jgi:hypothetical protein
MFDMTDTDNTINLYFLYTICRVIEPINLVTSVSFILDSSNPTYQIIDYYLDSKDIRCSITGYRVSLLATGLLPTGIS